MIHLLMCFVQLAIAKNNIIKLQEENQHLRSENSLILLKTHQQFEVHSCTITSIYISPCKNRLLLLMLVTVYDYKGKGNDIAGMFFILFTQVTQGDVLVERDTYKQSRQGLDEMYNEARRQLKEECQLRQVSMELPLSNSQQT